MSGQTTRDTLDFNQARASDPAQSAWVSANAGAGKTHVLVERILRLLLAGAEPGKILCLTYTKAAAAEMSNRVFARLSAWAIASADALLADLTKLMRCDPSPEHLIAARRMFAATLDAPGQMRIHTIHAFCERLLQRFPLEALLPPGFTVLDEAQANAALAEAFDATLIDASDGQNPAHAEALGHLLALVNERSLREIGSWAIAQRDTFRDMAALYRSGEDIAAGERAALRALLGLAPDLTAERVIAEMAAVLSDAELSGIVAALALGSSTDRERAQELSAALASKNTAARAAAFTAAFCVTEKNRLKPRARMATGAIPAALKSALEGARDTFFADLQSLTALRIAEASGAMLLFVDSVRQHYERAKTKDSVLDFADLIERTRLLLIRADAAAWVLYKLDGGIDHILLDEAQDTSAAQWKIVTQLAAEFFAGEGVARGPRTLFAVGDEKQSIFSFQGAAPERFALTGRALTASAEAAGFALPSIPLTVSFRSTAAVLETVDAVFARPEAAAGLTFAGDAIVHEASRKGHAGLVELWEIEEVIPPAPAPAFRPLNDQDVEAPSSAKLAERIASRIARMLNDGETLASSGRRIEPRDILILVRSRGSFAAGMVDALKAKAIPVAGADRMVLAEQLAVRDLTALGAFVLLPEDDLSLACVLKSPLIGLNDDDLFAIAYDRPGSLWSALRDRASENLRYADAVAQLEVWRGRADFIPPYEFYATLLDERGQEMRRRLLGAAGPGASDALDEFLESALRHDARAVPSLQNFLADFAAGASVVKRDMDQGRNEVRVMTVHGAKGLEANIVFLPDTCGLPPAPRGQLLPMKRKTAPPDSPPHLAHDFSGSQAVEEVRCARELRRSGDMAEYRRLLYVGMTRARDRLYVCGWKGKNAVPASAWQTLVRDAIGHSLQPAVCPDAGTVLRRTDTQIAPLDDKARDAPPLLVSATPPDWAFAEPAPERRPRVATPSSLDGGWDGLRDAGLADPPPLGPAALANDARFQRGRIAHLLLQHLPDLPEADWERAAFRLAEARGQDLGRQGRAVIVAETLAILKDAQFAPLFGAGSRAEVPFVARLPGGIEIAGQIDRLLHEGGRVLVADYKTNRPPPALPEDVAPAYLAQLAAYRMSLRLAFPELAVETALVWTDGPRLMPIPGALLDAAEQRIFTARPRP